MKKVMIGIGICIGLLGLAGCSTKQTQATHKTDEQRTTLKKTSSTSQSGKVKQSSAKSSSSTAPSTAASLTEKSSEGTSETVQPIVSVWDDQKKQQLQTFMQSWGATMGQTYKEYRPTSNVNFYGMPLPDAVLGAASRTPMAVDQRLVSAEWTDSGESSSEYSIVAVYSDAETTSGMATRHVYFFGFTKNQPVVLVSMQNQGMKDKALHFHETENQALNTAFQNIAAGNPVEQPVPEQAKPTWSSMDEAIDFYEATYKNPANEISKDILWENYDRSCWSVVAQNENRIVLHWRNIGGAGGSYTAFEKYDDHTVVTTYDGNNSYPNQPSKKFTVQNSDHQVINSLM